MSIGKKLKEAREKKKITLNQVYERTRIHPNVIEALEQDEYEKILNPTYIKSFLKAYASFLELDASKIIEEYAALKPQKAKEPPPSPQEEKPKETEVVDAKRVPKNVVTILKWTVIILAALFILRGLGRLTQNIKVHIAKQIQEQKIKAQAQAKIAKKKAPIKKPQVVQQEVAPKTALVPKDVKLVLNIIATDDVWVQLKVDGKVIFKNILKKNVSESWQADNNFIISIGKPEVAKVTLNGIPLDTSGKGGIKNLVIDREGIHN